MGVFFHEKALYIHVVTLQLTAFPLNWITSCKHLYIGIYINCLKHFFFYIFNKICPHLLFRSTSPLLVKKYIYHYFFFRLRFLYIHVHCIYKRSQFTVFVRFLHYVVYLCFGWVLTQGSEYGTKLFHRYGSISVFVEHLKTFNKLYTKRQRKRECNCKSFISANNIEGIYCISIIYKQPL